MKKVEVKSGFLESGLSYYQHCLVASCDCNHNMPQASYSWLDDLECHKLWNQRSQSNLSQMNQTLCCRIPMLQDIWNLLTRVEGSFWNHILSFNFSIHGKTHQYYWVIIFPIITVYTLQYQYYFLATSSTSSTSSDRKNNNIVLILCPTSIIGVVICYTSCN